MTKILRESQDKIAAGVVPAFARRLRTGRHKVPADLQKTLASAPAAYAAWEDITPLARNEWICWVTSAKKPETRKHRIERTRDELVEGMRRPCCWAGCPHR
ncbi:MAG: YdeI/OmpD-associated family protein [bacterium]|nr:YdeI/OmpD-associated family protein [bacterium]